ncbi:hypothetical protein ACFSUD_08390 [Sulfitobacter aestuarii]|uniref:Chaperone modulatory protein CbpM n=1 Tax=Sulfitobacter aestuarii TaxID=2161676 RepID=A0ABW5U2H8_9RHOB
MSDRYSLDEALAQVARLDRARLVSYMEAQIILPLQTPQGPSLRKIDIKRLELACELSDEFGLEEDALGVVLSLLDQLHGLRAELRDVLGALEEESPEVRARIAAAIARRHGAPGAGH